VAARLERDVQRRATRAFSGSLECDSLGVRPRRRLRTPFAGNDAVRGDDDRADGRVRRRRLGRFAGEVESALHMLWDHGADIIA
jgi:hypothetical protein